MAAIWGGGVVVVGCGGGVLGVCVGGWGVGVCVCVGGNFLSRCGTGFWRYNQDSHGQALWSALMIGFLD